MKHHSLRFPFGQVLGTRAVASVLLLIAATAQAGSMDPPSDPAYRNAYIGIGYGPQIRTGCDGAATCESGRTAVKVFGGYRFTPSLATEISYYYLGDQERTWTNGSPGQPTYSTVVGTTQRTFPVQKDTLKTHAIAVGLALESEMFPNAFNGRLIQHLRAGLAMTRTETTMEYSGTYPNPAPNTQNPATTLTAKGTAKSAKNRVVPYVGAGLSYGLSPKLRVFSSIDGLIGPERNFYVITFGGGAEF